MRYAASVEYEGTNFSGWQRQSSVLSVQEEIEKAISNITQTSIEIQGAGRTDAGVHALGQIFHLDTDVIRPIKSIIKGTNSFLPDSIRIKWVKEVSSDFHARFSALSREYQYLLNNNPIKYEKTIELFNIILQSRMLSSNATNAFHSFSDLGIFIIEK